MKKRLLSVLLTFCMLLTLLPVSALAAPVDSEWSENSDSEYFDYYDRPERKYDVRINLASYAGRTEVVKEGEIVTVTLSNDKSEFSPTVQKEQGGWFESDTLYVYLADAVREYDDDLTATVTTEEGYTAEDIELEWSRHSNRYNGTVESWDWKYSGGGWGDDARVTYVSNWDGDASIRGERTQSSTQTTVIENPFDPPEQYDNSPENVFAGWNTEWDGSGEAYEADDNIEIPEDGITLYAQWNRAVKFFVFKGNQTPGENVDTAAGNYYPNSTDNGGVSGANTNTGFQSGYLTQAGYAALKASDQYDASQTPVQMLFDTTRNALNSYLITNNLNLGRFDNDPSTPVSWYVIKEQSDGIHCDGYVTNISIDIVYHANFDGDGGNETYTQNALSGYEFDILGYNETELPARPGYSFQGWSTSANGEVVYEPGEKEIFTGGQNLYAVWDENTVTINYEALEGGSVSPKSETVGVNDDPKGSTATAEDGWHFVGWYDNKACTGNPVGTDEKFVPKTASAATYYAKFERNQTLNIVITGDVEEVTYDGQSHTASGYTVTYNDSNDAPEGVTVTLKEGVTASVTRTNVLDSKEMGLTEDSFTVTAPEGYTVNLTVTDGRLTINPKPVTVQANDAKKTFGTADPILTATVTGLIDGDTIEYTVSREAGEDVGTYTITPTGAETQGNYTVTYRTGTFTITKASASGELTATGYSGEYDGAPHGITVAGALEEDTLYYSTNGTDWSQNPFTYTNVTNGPVTVYVKAENPSYADRTTQATIEITPRKITITVDDTTKIFGQDDPGFTGSITYGSLVNDNDLGTITYSRTNTDEAVGTYEDVLTASYTENANYNVTVVKGDFTITTASTEGAAVTASGGKWTYDGQAHTVTASLNEHATNYTIYYKVGDGEWTTTVPSVTNVEDGILTVSVKAVRDGYADLTCDDVTIQITPATLTVTTPSASKVYDGTPLTSTEGSVSGLVSGETVTLTVTGSQTGIGSSQNVYSLDWNGTAKQSNYTIVENLGTLTVTSATGVTVVKEAAEPPVGGYVAGDTITWTITVTNTGTETVHGLSLTDSLPGVTLSNKSGVDPTNFNLAAGGSVTFTATLANAPAGTYTNYVTVSQNGTDLGNDPADPVIVTEQAPHLTVSKEADKDTAQVGDTVNYTITVANTGNVPLNNVTVTDTFTGAGVLTFTDSTAYTVNNNGDGTYTITIGNMAKGASVTITATYIVLEADASNNTITNTAAAKATELGDKPVEDEETVTVSGQFTLIYNANGGSFDNEEETFTVPNLSGGTYTLTDTQGYNEPTNGNYVFIGWSETQPETAIGAGEEIPDCITEVTLNADNPTRTVYAVWGEDKNDDGVADAQQVFIEPAPIVIYTGGAGYNGAVQGSSDSEVGTTSTGLPEPGFYITLPHAVDAELKTDAETGEIVNGALDLSNYLSFSYYDDAGNEIRHWNLERYDMGSGDSQAYNRFIYRMLPDTYTDTPIRLQFTDEDGNITITDTFPISMDELSQNYSMTIYDGGLNQKAVTANIVGITEDITVGVDSSTLTVRGVTAANGVPTTTEVLDSAPDSQLDNIQAHADGEVTYYINDSDLEVRDPSAVALLVDELVDEGVDTLLAEAEDRLGLAWYEDYEYQTQYLDLVDTSNGNAYVTLGEGDSVDIHWPMPNGTSRWNTEFYVVHFDGLDRNFDDLDAQLDYGNVDLQVYTLGDGLRIENGNLVFTTDTFSPFVLIWQDSDRDWPDDDDDDDNDRPSHDDDDDNDRPEQEDPAPELDKESHIAYVSGTPEGTIEPNAYITREEVATIFFRLLTDRSRANYITNYNPFPDVDSSRWSFYPIVTMNNAGIMHGYDDGNFAPSGYITRAEFAVVAAQFSDAEYTGADLFSDISGHWAREYINRAASEGWISGYPDGSFGPDDYITRAQVMALVNEVLDRAPDADYMLDDMITWPDNADESAWYYEDVQEATNSHSYVWRNSGRTSEEWEDLIDTRTLDELVRDAFNGVGISY